LGFSAENERERGQLKRAGVEEDNTRIDLKEIGWDCLESTDLAQGREKNWAVVSSDKSYG
jgi:hypothetical protein